MEIDLAEVTSKISNKGEAKRFYEEEGKIIFNFQIGYYFPDIDSFNCEHFYNCIAGNKKLIPLEAAITITMKNYSCVEELQKKSLLNYCLSKEALRSYLPDSTNLLSIPRDYFLQVSFRN